MILKHYLNPAADWPGETPEDFLKVLGGPCSILIEGEDQSRCRALVTLLHGNEPSGLMAIQRWIRSGGKPSTNILCIIASVEAALCKPVFSHRMLPNTRDLNRCFKEPFDDQQGRLAQAILQCLKAYRPECVIDMHNTSGASPAFGVAVYEDKFHDMLVSLFTDRLIVTDIRLNAIMEITEFLAPTVTIEVGGRLDQSAHQLAWEGLCRFFLEPTILQATNVVGSLEVMKNPVRLELRKNCRLRYDFEPLRGIDVTLDPVIERLNNGVTKKDTFLGWTSKIHPDELFIARNGLGQCVLEEILYVEKGRLLTRQALKLFMVTTNTEIATSDCLFYAVKSDGSELETSATSFSA